MLAEPSLVAIGFALGLFVTLVGGGGGVFYLLVLLSVGLPYRTAVPTSLATVILTTAVGSLSHLREGNVAWRVGLVVVLGGVGGTFLGSLVVDSVDGGTLRRVFGGFLLVVAVALSTLDVYGPQGPRRSLTPPVTLFTLGLGSLTGLASATFGISGTPVLLPGLYALGFSGTAVVGTSVFCILGVALAGTAWYSSVGGLDWRLVGLFGLGAGAGAVVAPRLLRLVPAERFDRAFGWFVKLSTAVAGVGFLLGLV